MLIERLFSSGTMQMGPSRIDPNRQVGVSNPETIRDLPTQRAAEMRKIAWMAGGWDASLCRTHQQLQRLA